MPSPLLGLRLWPLAASGLDREFVLLWLDEPIGDGRMVDRQQARGAFPVHVVVEHLSANSPGERSSGRLTFDVFPGRRGSDETPYLGVAGPIAPGVFTGG